MICIVLGLIVLMVGCWAEPAERVIVIVVFEVTVDVGRTLAVLLSTRLWCLAMGTLQCSASFGKTVGEESEAEVAGRHGYGYWVVYMIIE